MRDVLDNMENNIKRQMEIKKEQQRQQKQIADINNKVDDITSKKVPEGYLNAAKIALKLNLTSSNDRLHSALIGKVTKHIGIRSDESAPYEDEYVKIVFGGDNIGQMTYYSPKAINIIKGWWELNEDKLEYETYYKRNSKYGNKGDLREKGYKIGKSKYTTYKAINSKKAS